MPRRGSILLTTANEIGSALVDKLGGSGYAPVEWDKKINIMGISSEDIPDALDNLIPSEGGGDRGSILISKANEIGAVLNKKFNTDRGFKPKEWASAISKLTPLQVKTASGAIASFPDGADAVPLTSLVCDINPKQDLHGYSKPWAPGAGKNKLGIPSDVDTTTDGVRVQYSKESGSFTVSGTNTNTSSHLLKRWYATSNEIETPSFVIGDTYTLLCDINLPLYMQFTYRDSNNSIHAMGYMQFSTGKVTFTIPSDFATLAELQLYCNGTATSVSGSFHIWLESGSISSSAFEPYSNVCPIEGSTETTAYQKGKNWAKISDNTKRSGQNCTYTYENNGVTINAAGTYARIDYTIPLIVGATYTFSCKASSDAGYRRIGLRYGESWTNYLYNQTITETETDWSYTFTASEDHVYLSFYLTAGSIDVSGTMTVKNIQIEVGSTPTTFEAFKQKTPVVAQFGETIYGGYVDIVTGILTLTNALKIFAGEESEGWGTYPAYNGFYAEITDMKLGTRLDGLSNMLVKSTTSAQGQTNAFWLGVNNNRIYVIGVYESIANTLAKFKEFLSTHNLFVTYPLATPIEIDLDNPQEVESYLGYNNIYNDTGDTSASYYADIDLNNV